MLWSSRLGEPQIPEMSRKFDYGILLSVHRILEINFHFFNFLNH